jgi:hypothetical protein
MIRLAAFLVLRLTALPGGLYWNPTAYLFSGVVCRQTRRLDFSVIMSAIFWSLGLALAAVLLWVNYRTSGVRAGRGAHW